MLLYVTECRALTKEHMRRMQTAETRSSERSQRTGWRIIDVMEVLEKNWGCGVDMATKKQIGKTCGKNAKNWSSCSCSSRSCCRLVIGSRWNGRRCQGHVTDKWNSFSARSGNRRTAWSLTSTMMMIFMTTKRTDTDFSCGDQASRWETSTWNLWLTIGLQQVSLLAFYPHTPPEIMIQIMFHGGCYLELGSNRCLLITNYCTAECL
jgi:hypothetical protein